MTMLTEYLEARNAEIQAWVDEDPENRWAGLLVTDPDHWAEYGVTTVAEFERHELETQYYDLFKDAHGVRPCHVNFDEFSNEELRQMISDVADEVSRQLDDQEAEDKAFWDRMNKMSQEFGITLATALRWTMDAYDDDDEDVKEDVEYFCHLEGISYWNADRIKEIL